MPESMAECFRGETDRFDSPVMSGSCCASESTASSSPAEELFPHRARTHLALDKDGPDRRAIMPRGEIVAISKVGGLHHRTGCTRSTPTAKELPCLTWGESQPSTSFRM
jgi:hypothetical protein